DILRRVAKHIIRYKPSSRVLRKTKASRGRLVFVQNKKQAAYLLQNVSQKLAERIIGQGPFSVWDAPTRRTAIPFNIPPLSPPSELKIGPVDPHSHTTGVDLLLVHSNIS